MLKGEVFPRHIDEGVHRAAAQGGGPPVQGHIQRGVDHAHNGVGSARQIVHVVLLQGQLQPVPHLKAQLDHQQAFGDALVRRLGQAALLYLQQVELFRQGAHVDDAVCGNCVQIPAALHLPDAA